MKISLHIETLEELEVAHQNGVHEVLLGHHELSTQGTLSTQKLHELAEKAHAYSMRAVLLWDTMMRDYDIDRCIHTLSKINLDLFDSVRVLDAGAIEYALEETSLRLQLILKNGAHNLTSILSWINYSPRVEKVLLSSEISKKHLVEYRAKIPVEVELLGLAPILLLYTPRHLLSYRIQESQGSQDSQIPKSSQTLQHQTRATADCDENTHRNFRVLETQHGTLLFHAKDYCLLDVLHELEDMKIDYFQIDLRLIENLNNKILQLNQACNVLKGRQDYKSWASQYPKRVMHCFYNTNATDVLFKKLKNTTIQRQDQNFIGEVVESIKDKHTIIRPVGLHHHIKLGDTLQLITPNGKDRTHVVSQLKNLSGESVSKIQSGDFAVLPFVRSVTAASVVYSINMHPTAHTPSEALRDS